MKTPILNVGLVGFGMSSQVFHAPLIQATPGLELSCVVSGDPDKVQRAMPEVEMVAKAAELYARADIDLVVIATPNATHYPLAKAALAAGKHVVVDKPFTISLSEARLLKQQAEEAERTLCVFHNRRWDSDFLTLKGVMEEGTLGRVVAMESRFDRFRPDVPDRWRERRGPGAGLWYDLGPHLLDQARELFGMPRAILLDIATRRDGAEVDDDFLALLDYNGVRVSLSAATLAAEPTPRFRVHGTRGSFVKFGLDPQEARLKAGETPSPQWGDDPLMARLTLADGEGNPGEPRELRCQPGDYLAFYSGVAEHLVHATPPPVDIDGALEVMALLESGLDSYRQGRWVKL
ncbi:oxidoreductase [Halomonas urumqiensis]|uniref:Oxidoreductase n=1 Tax=Halomonas urumqiensis TaxID=1684789 RepID=A0A2N7UCA2_9GAMM|nr:oxidoreductase [Halomonas urumqiensis]PMR78072.1 oxidoreductase [Halomonas urumqiensis]PTB03223.1 oxidoreductase [Halomonas urumqiensis]GHE20624.1 oxidoreductase [Halomonas urumqiensis]